MGSVCVAAQCAGKIGEIEIAKIPFHCCRWSTWFSGPVLGWLDGYQPIGHQVSLWDVRDQYHCLPDYWLRIDFPGKAYRAERRVEISNSNRLCWSVQYIFNVRMGDVFQLADRRVLYCFALCCFEHLTWAGCCMVRSSDREVFRISSQRRLKLEERCYLPERL